MFKNVLYITFYCSICFLLSNNCDRYTSLFLLIEATLVYIFIISLQSRKTSTVVWLAYSVLLGAQISSIISTGDYIIPLTIMNLSEASAIGFSQIFKITAIFLAYLILAMPVYFLPRLKSPWLKLFIFPVLFLQGPLTSSFATLSATYKQMTFEPTNDSEKVAKKFLKYDIYKSSSFPAEMNIKEHPNVIVIFTEGLSEQVIDVANKKGLNVTPNLDKYYNEQFIIKNYFNHTAATFRGLRGQLTSGYQYKGGFYATGTPGVGQISIEELKKTYNNSLISIADILKSNGYGTYFLSADSSNSNLNNLIESLNFDKVYGKEDFVINRAQAMSDKQTFESLKKIVEKTKDKFFIGVYSVGTHHGMDSPDEKYQDGKNPYYNKFHNYDAQLGKFVDWFKQSPYYDNTILIITADHATFPSPEYKESFGSNAKYFVDRVPFILIGSGIHHFIYDAKGKNSLGTAPTILNLLKINRAPNYFLGCSLFDIDCHSKFMWHSAVGDGNFLTIPHGKEEEYQVTATKADPDIQTYYNISH